MSRRRIVVALATMVAFLPTASVFAGTNDLEPGKWTVISHGAVFGGAFDAIQPYEQWQWDLGERIDVIGGSTEVVIHTVDRDTFALTPSEFESDKHHVLLWDWSETSVLVDLLSLDPQLAPDGYAYAASDALYTLLMHYSIAAHCDYFIGHSRGSIVVSETVRRLILSGFDPTQVIYLDGEGGVAPLSNDPYEDDVFDAWQGSNGVIKYTAIYSTVDEGDYCDSYWWPDWWWECCYGGSNYGGPPPSGPASRMHRINRGSAYRHGHCDMGTGYRPPPIWEYLIDGMTFDGDVYAFPHGESSPTSSQISPVEWHGHSSDYLLFNGDFEWYDWVKSLNWERSAGWWSHGGGGTGHIDHLFASGSYLALGSGYSHLTHAISWIPSNATDLEFQLYVADPDYVNCNDVVRVSVDCLDGNSVTFYEADVLCQWVDLWTVYTLSLPASVRGKAAKISISIEGNGDIQSELYAKDFGILREYEADGACCLDYECHEWTASTCAEYGGKYMGDGWQCSGGDCDAPATGACCNGDECTIVTAGYCDGSFLGVGSDCLGNPCTVEECYRGHSQWPNELFCYSDPGVALKISFTNLPGRTVSRVEYYVDVSHDCTDDVIVLLFNQDKDGQFFYPWFEPKCGCTDCGQDDDLENDGDILFDWRSTDHFNHDDMNQTWWLGVSGHKGGDEDDCGTVHELGLHIYYDAPGTPDRAILEVSTNPIKPIAGEPCELQLRVKNTGSGLTGSMNFEYQVDGVPVADGWHDDLQAGEEAEVSEDYTFAEPGFYEVTVEVDRDQCLGEMNLGNNSDTIQVEVIERSGACCRSGSCSVVTADTCGDYSDGVYQGDWTGCESGTCRDADGVLHVPSEYPQLQAALDWARTGDEVRLASGTTGSPAIYYGSFNMNGRSIILRSQDGADKTILDAQQNGPCLTSNGGVLTVEGLTLRNGYGDQGGGLVLDDPVDCTITSCIFRNNQGVTGGGMWCTGGAGNGPVIANCLFEDNQASGDGGGVYLNYGSASGGPSITNCQFIGNTANRGGGLRAGDSGYEPLSLSGCLFNGNEATQQGGGMFYQTWPPTAPPVQDCEFSQNTAPWGGGIVWQYGNGHMTNCVVRDNTATNGSGGGVLCDEAAVTLESCAIQDNRASRSGGGLHLMACEDATISGGEVTGNVATLTGGGLLVDGGDVVLVGVEVTGNTANSGGGIALESGSLVIADATVCGNSPDELVGGYAAMQCRQEDCFTDFDAAWCVCDAADLDQDGFVGVSDLNMVVQHWGFCDWDCLTHGCPGDIARDCDVDLRDLLVVLEWWGTCQ